MKIRVLRTGRMVGTLLVSLFFAGISVKAAYLRSVPQLLQQPDGRSLSCFATGDEYYHWLHDAANFTIIKDVSSGYYVYAQKSGDQLIPTSLVAGIADPVASGLQPGINLSGEQIGQIRKNHIIYSTLKTIHKPGLAKDDPSIQGAPQTGDVNNLVVYIRFSDEIEWTDDTTTYFNKFNNTTAGYNSMRNYYDEVSYGQLDISSTFYPQPSGSTVISYQDANPRSYYQIYDASTNPGGYQDDAERTSREHTLLKNAVADIASEVPGGLDIDGDNDGFVDNVCFIVTGVPDGWSELLWPHRWALYSQTAMINGKRVWDYNFQIRSSLNSSGVGVLCHEMFHSIGAPDLYHYVDNGISPVGPWDIMENDANPPQHMSAYMKYRYGGWISDIPEITSDGDYTLNPLVSSTNNCYKIASPNSTTEYYVLEYREDTGPFESSLPNSGLLVFRINTDEDGNGNADGPPDEVYLYRPNGTTVVDGSVYQAFFSAASGRTAINDATNPDPFLSDGSAGGLDISAIGAAGATISFHVGLSGASPSADFEASATSACPGSAIDFSDLSTNTPTSWTWTFTPATVTYVGATTQNSQDPQVQFDATGTYTVQLDATNLDGTDTEIKVDYITISDAQSLPFTEGFENIVFPPNGWSITNPDADKTWERFSPTGGLGTGNGSAYVFNWDYMVSGQLDALITPPIDLSASLSATMIFYHAYRVYPGQAEELNIYISTDCGLTYLPAPLFSKSGYDLETSPDPGGGEMLQPAIISDWERDSIDLTPYVGNTVTIMFEQTSDWGNNLYLDDINIFEPAQAPQTGFIVDMTTACETEVVSFTDTTLNIPTAWTWTFTPATVSYAGATNANSQNPQVIFDAAGSYTVELVATNSGGSDAVTKTNLMTINVMAEPSITGNATVDESTSESYSTTDNSASGYTYMWVVSGGTIASGQGTADITVDWGLGGAGQVSVTETTDLGCDSTAVQSITIQGNSPHPSITGTSELCENTTGFSYSTTDNTGDGNTYVWYVSAGGTIVSGQNTPEIVVDWSAAGADTVIVTETDPLLVSENDTLFITVSTTPVADAGADQDICAGETATLVASGGSTYLWSTAETTASIDVSPADTTKYYVTVSNGCDAVDSVTVNVIEVPPPAISGNDAICESNLETYSTTDNSGIGNTYLWVVSGGTIISGQNTSDIVVDWGTMGAGYVKVTETTALAVSASDSLPVAISQGTSPDIAGTNGAYENATSVLYTTDDNSLFGATYFWEVVGGTIAGGQATPQITVDWGVAGAGEVIVTETNSGGCSNTDTVFVIIMAGSGPTPSISGPTGACLGETGVQYYTTDETASGIVYLWSVTGGTITSGQSTPTIIVTWDVADTARIILRAYDGFVFNRDTLYVIVTDQPVAEAGSDQEICEGEPAQLVASGGTEYFWSSGDLGSDISVTPADTTKYYVTVSDGSCSATDSVTVNIITMPVPMVVGSSSVLSGATGEIFSTTDNQAIGYTYLWSVTNSVIQTGQFTPAIDANIGVAGTAEIVVEETNDICSSTDTLLVTIIPDPQIIGEDTICAFSTYDYYTPNYSAYGNTYIWEVTGGTIVGNPTLTNISVIWDFAGIAQIKLTETNLTGQSTVKIMDVLIKPLPAITTTPDTTICEGTNLELTVSGGTSYFWNTWDTNDTIVVSPSINTTYYVTATLNECTATDDIKVTVTDGPDIFAGSDSRICEGESLTTTASGALSYLWSTGETTASITVTPDTTTAYTVTGPNAAGCYASATVVVYVTELPIADAGADQNLCLGSTATLKGNGGTDYIWSTVETTDSILVSPLVTSTYSVTVSNECGSDTDEITVTVVGLPVADAGTIKYINAGDTTTLDGSATGGNGPLSYLWDPAQSIIDETIDTAFAHPSTTTLYILTVTDSLGCVALDSTAILIDSIPYVDAGPAIIEVCSGLSTVLPAVVYGGAQPVSYAWLPVTDLDDPAILNPTTSTTITRTYTLVVTAANGRTASDSIVVSVLDAAVAEAGFDKHICPGSSSTLKASGGLFFEWNTGETTPRITVTPADTTTYYVTVTNSFGCVSDDSVTVFVFPEAVGSAGNDSRICAGDTARLDGSGGTSYVWSNDGITDTIYVNPVFTTNYFLTITDVNGCKDYDTVKVTIDPLPGINTTPERWTCSGIPITLSTFFRPNYSYAWSTGETTNSIVVAPIDTTTYTIVVTDTTGCQRTDSVFVAAYPLPLADAGVDTSVCLGLSIDLITSGSDLYYWSDGTQNDTATVSPTVTTTYTLQAINSFGCNSIDDVVVTVIPLANVSAGNDTSVCHNDTLFLTGNGGISYAWSTGETTAGIAVEVTYNHSVVMTATDALGCQGVDTVVITNLNLPVADAGDTRFSCYAGQVMLQSQLNSNYEYDWSTGDTTYRIYVYPTDTTTIYVTVTATTGCSATDSVTINVAPQVIANAGADTSICLGNTVDLIATGGSNYFWTGGFNNDTLSVTPSVSTVYGVSVTDAMGCSGTDEVAVTITYNASASAGYDTSVCRGSYVELVGIGGVSYEWSTGDLTDTIQVSPNSNTDFYITVTDATGCKGIDTINVEVLQLPLVSGGTKFICLGSTVELKTQYSTNYSYLWSTGAITNKINVSPPDTTTYYISVTNSNSCIAVDSFIVEVFFPEADAGPDVNICNGETAMLIPYNSGLYYSWSTGEWTDTIYVSPITTTTYILSVTQPNGCRATDTVVVVVDQLLTASAGPDTAVCNLDSIVLHGSGGIGFVWSTGSTNQSITVGPIAPTTYSITVTDANGCVGYADVYVGVKPKPTFSISGDSEICAGDNGEIKATSSVQFTYLWNTGSTSNKITVSPDTTTVYYVTVTNGYQCSRTDSANLIVNPLPPIPEISIFVSLGDTFLISSPAFSYQWLFYSNSIPSANYQTYAPSESGIYSVLIHDENGCMNVSDTLALYFISDEFTDAAHNWTVYPNPAESEVIVDITGISDVFVLRLTDISGQELFAETFEPSSQFRQTWDVSHLAAGVYFIRLETESGISVKKLILTR